MNGLKWAAAIIVGFAFGAGGVCLLSGAHTTKDYIVMGVVAVMPTLGALKTNLEKQLGISVQVTAPNADTKTTVTTHQE